MNNNYNRNQNNQFKKQEQICIYQPLSEYYNDGAKLYLPTGSAYQYANQFKGIPTHQLRKILNETKEALIELNRSSDGYKDARNRMFGIVAMTAYNSGRMMKLSSKDKEAYKNLFYFIKAHLSEKTIISPKDIVVFDKLFTSIIAYHTSINQLDKENKRGGKS